MGNISGTTQISYKTKTDIPINYIFYDLKGKSRYPDEPNNETESIDYIYFSQWNVWKMSQWNTSSQRTTLNVKRL